MHVCLVARWWAWRSDRENSCPLCRSRRDRRRKRNIRRRSDALQIFRGTQEWMWVGEKVLMLLSVCLLVAVVAVAVMLAACHLTLCFALHLSPCHKLWQVDSSRVCVLGNNLNKNNTRNASALSGSRCSIGRRLWHAAEGQILSLLSLLSLERFLNVGNCSERLKEIRNFMFSI